MISQNRVNRLLTHQILQQLNEIQIVNLSAIESQKLYVLSVHNEQNKLHLDEDNLLRMN